MDLTLLHSIQSMEAQSSTATSLLALSTVFGRLKTLKVKPEDLLLELLLPFTVQELLFAFTMPKTTRSKSWLWWKLELKKSGSYQTLISLLLTKLNFSVFPAKEFTITHPSGKFMNNTFAQVSVLDTQDVLLLILINCLWRSKVFTSCFTLSCIHQECPYFTKCAHSLSWSKRLEELPLMVRSQSLICKFKVMNKKQTLLLEVLKMSNT